MLREITITNFKSFAKKVVFSMEADTEKVQEYPSHYLTKCGLPILKISSFYGPNGGGKSNLLNAILFVKKVAVSKYTDYRQAFNESCPFESSKINPKDPNITISAYFVNDDFELGYSFTVQMKKDTAGIVGGSIASSFINRDFYIPSIQREEIVARPKDSKEFDTLLSRNEQGIIVSSFFSDLPLKTPSFSLNPQVSALSYIANTFNLSQRASQERHYLALQDLWEEINSIEVFDPNWLMLYIDKNDADFINKNQDQMVSLLRKCGVFISEIQTKPNKHNYYDIILKRKRENGEVFSVYLDNESSGTQKLFQFILIMLENNRKNRIFLFNDFDALLHPKLSAFVLSFFTDPANINVQCILNSHDILNMNKDTFRRDEIWFAFKDEDYSTQLVSLSNIVDYRGTPIRNDAKYSKQYLEGKFGGDPFISKGANWYDD